MTSKFLEGKVVFVPEEIELIESNNIGPEFVLAKVRTTTGSIWLHCSRQEVCDLLFPLHEEADILLT